jgi:hypothetical protein
MREPTAPRHGQPRSVSVEAGRPSDRQNLNSLRTLPLGITLAGHRSENRWDFERLRDKPCDCRVVVKDTRIRRCEGLGPGA